MDLQLKGRTALVSGATEGLGLDVAQTLSNEGAHVFITGCNRRRLEAAAERVRKTANGDLTLITADFRTAEGIAAITNVLPGVDIIVNYLGVSEIWDSTAIDDPEWLRCFELNVLWSVELSCQLLPYMLEQDWGRIVFVSGELGLMTANGVVHYGMTPSAQLAISRGLTELTAGTGVTVNAVLPGQPRSEVEGACSNGLASHLRVAGATHGEAHISMHPSTEFVQRLTKPDEVANLVAFVASPLCSASVGAAVAVLL